MVSDLYSGKILDAAAAIPPARRLENPDASARKVSRVCGSEVEVDLKVENGRVADFGMRARACALGQAAASIVANHIVGASVTELRDLSDAMRSMLKNNGRPPAGPRWSDLAMLQAIKDYPQRHASTLLIFDAVVACLDEIAAKADPDRHNPS